MTSIAEYANKAKWKWDGHITQMKETIWTIRSIEWQIKGSRSVAKLNCCWSDDIVGNREWYGHRQQRTEKIGALWWRATSWKDSLEKNGIE